MMVDVVCWGHRAYKTFLSFDRNSFFWRVSLAKDMQLRKDKNSEVLSMRDGGFRTTIINKKK